MNAPVDHLRVALICRDEWPARVGEFTAALAEWYAAQ